MKYFQVWTNKDPVLYTRKTWISSTFSLYKHLSLHLTYLNRRRRLCQIITQFVEANALIVSKSNNTSVAKICGGMILQNLANIQWMDIGCTSQFHVDVFCFGEMNRVEKSAVSNSINFNTCGKQGIVLDGICSLITWQKRKTINVLSFRQVDNLLAKFLFLFACVDPYNLPPIFSKGFSKKVHFVQHVDVIKHFTETIQEGTEQFALSMQLVNSVKIKIGGNLFFCLPGYYVSATIKDLPHTCRNESNKNLNSTRNPMCLDMQHRQTRNLFAQVTFIHEEKYGTA